MGGGGVYAAGGVHHNPCRAPKKSMHISIVHTCLPSGYEELALVDVKGGSPSKGVAFVGKYALSNCGPGKQVSPCLL